MAAPAHVDLQKEFPIKVRYPLGGKFLLLLWSTESRGQNILLASSPEGLQILWKRLVLKSGENVKIHYVWNIQIVGPPPELREELTAYLYQDALTTFHNAVAGHVFALGNSQLTPEGYVRCTTYKYMYNFGAQMDEAEDLTHDHCANCFRSWIPEGQTVEDLYWRARHVFARAPYVSKTIVERPLSVEAPAAQNDDEVFAFVEDIGHHHTGMLFTKYYRTHERPSDPEAKYEFPALHHNFSHGITFLFRHLDRHVESGTPVKAELIKTLLKIRADREGIEAAQKAEAKAAFAERRRKENQSSKDKLAELLTLAKVAP